MRKIILILGLCSLPALAVAAGAGHARDNYADARAMMREASRFVTDRQKEVERAGSTGDIVERLGLSRFYKPGDSWVVAVSFKNLGFTHKADDEAAHKVSYLDPQFYEFKVARTTDNGEAVIDVSQVGPEGQALEAMRIKQVRITINRKLRLSSKEYHYRDLAQPVTAELSSERNFPMGFDSFPVELPDFDRARAPAREHAGAKALPPQLQRHFRIKLDPAQVVGFESPDLFARPMRVSWQRGDLWPAIVETNSGISILVKQEKK